ncbi:hypothetical protein D3C87_1451720 [compost metagenome]
MDIAGSDGFRHHAGGVGFGLGQTLAGLGIAERRFALAFRLENGRLFCALCAQNLSIAGALGLQHLRAFFTLRLHLPCHGIDEIFRRRDIFDLDARDLDTPWSHRLVDHAQQAIVDGITVRQ